ncbi:virulence factor SrfC family protein [Limibacter armeniacum]|uniref:virulence factor SrfC family protein n=1 Tax=Limibacter armeniacum TaxID=466084 RepID=UPI002FE6B96F
MTQDTFTAKVDMQDLIKQAENIQTEIDKGLNWVAANVKSEKQKATLYNLKKSKRKLKGLVKASGTRPGIGVFGASQVGKSYLVSNLVRLPGEDKLTIRIPGQEGNTLDFIRDINPPGGGKESTGVVTRFTIADNHQAGEQPYTLKLFSQADMVKIITNGYLADINQYHYTLDPETINGSLQQIALQVQQTGYQVPGMTEDDVYEIKEYLEQNFSEHIFVGKLSDIGFWDKAVRIAPYINPKERVKLFECLWGKQPFFTDLFRKVSETLEQVQFATVLRCGVEALAPNTTTVLDIERLREMYQGETEITSAVSVHLPDGSSRSLNRSALTAVLAEVVLPILPQTAQDSSRSFLQYADVLDFPGARSRKKVPEQTFQENSQEEKLEIFLRGKVAFLFDTYCNDLVINTLVYAMNNKQLEVSDLPHLIYKWIRNTHGGTPQEREKRENTIKELTGENGLQSYNPFLVVQTMYNLDLDGNPTIEKVGEPATHNAKWDARLQANFHDFFGTSVSDKWTEKWTAHDTFKNVFFLRDPEWSQNVFEGWDEKKKETSVRPSYMQKLQDMKTSFLSHSYVRKHIREPEEAWDASSTPEHDGANYIIEHLKPTCHPAVKKEQVNGAMQQCLAEVNTELEAYYEGGGIDEQLQKARKKALRVAMRLNNMQTNNNTFGHFMDRLVMSYDLAWTVYFSLHNSFEVDELGPQAQPSPTVPIDLIELLKGQGVDVHVDDSPEVVLDKLQQYFGLPMEDIREELKAMDIDIESLLEEKAKEGIAGSNYKDRAQVFADKLLTRWVDQLQMVKEDAVLSKISLPKEVAEYIIDELLKGIYRLRIKDTLIQATRDEINSFPISNNYDIVPRIASSILNRYVTTAGWAYVPDQEKQHLKRPNSERTLFSAEEKPTPDKQELKLGQNFPGQDFFNEWVFAIQKMFEANVMASHNMADSQHVAANAGLGNILKSLEEMNRSF